MTAALRRRALTVALVIIGALATPAIAAATCDMSSRSDNQTNYAGVYFRSDGGGSGFYDYLKSNINVRNPNLAPNCSANSCGSYAWIQMESNSQADYAQWGPFRGYVLGSNVDAGTAYLQCKGTSGQYDDFPVTSAVGSSPLYTLNYGTDPVGQHNNKIALLNGFIWSYCGGLGNPFTFTPVKAEMGTEIHDEKTQMPGSQSTNEVFTNSVAIDPGSGSSNFFNNGSWLFLNQQGFIQHNIVNSSTLHTWDDDCT